MLNDIRESTLYAILEKYVSTLPYYTTKDSLLATNGFLLDGLPRAVQLHDPNSDCLPFEVVSPPVQQPMLTFHHPPPVMDSAWTNTFAGPGGPQMPMDFLQLGPQPQQLGPQPQQQLLLGNASSMVTKTPSLDGSRSPALYLPDISQHGSLYEPMLGEGGFGSPSGRQMLMSSSQPGSQPRTPNGGPSVQTATGSFFDAIRSAAFAGSAAASEMSAERSERVLVASAERSERALEAGKEQLVHGVKQCLDDRLGVTDALVRGVGEQVKDVSK